jgi:hypothetical protein
MRTALVRKTRLSARAVARKVGGARRDRTDDLLLAKQALSQLSYGPARLPPFNEGDAPCRCRAGQAASQPFLRMVGLGRLELPTSRLSGVRSNHLSYRPDAKRALLPEERETKTAVSRLCLEDPIRLLRSVHCLGRADMVNVSVHP